MLKTIEQKTLKFILDNNLLESGDSVLIALSGGADSIFLFNFLYKFKRRFNITLGCFHLNHNLRGAESKRDEKFCHKLAAETNCRFFSSSKNVKLYADRNGISVEEAGRELRYREFDRHSKKYKFNKIATAHHSDDNTETILLNIIKGAGIKGLTGIPVKRGNIIRPLLCLSKDEILNYLNEKKIAYCFDSSNVNVDYYRNYLRNEIIPLIKNKLNPQFDNAVLRMSGVIKNLTGFIDNEINSMISEASEFKRNELKVYLSGFNKLNSNLHGEFFKEIINRYFEIDLEYRNVIDLSSLIKKESGKKISLSGKLIAAKERDYLLISLKLNKKVSRNSINLIPGQTKKIGRYSISVSEVKKSSVNFDMFPDREYISADNVKGKLQIRNWANGDKFFPLGMKHSKKISDFLNEQKIESFMKKDHLVMINSDNILWVVGLRIDDRYKVTKRTKRVLELCLNR